MRLDVPDLADEVVRLRPPALADVDAITAECQDPEIPRFTRIMSPYGREDAVRFVEDAGRNAPASPARVCCGPTSRSGVGSPMW